MKKILAMGIAALVLITLSSCQLNIFAAFDKIEIPSAADLSNEADSDPDSFVSNVNDYLDSDSITEENAVAIVAALESVYSDTAIQPADLTNEEWVEVQQEAAVLAGAIAINSDPETSAVVDGIISVVSTALGAAEDIDPQLLVGDIFPPSLDEAGVTDILDQLSLASAAYSDFAQTIDANNDGVMDSTADWMTDGEIGDVVQYAAVAMVVTDIREALIVSEGSEALADAAIYDLIVNGEASGTTINIDPFNDSNDILAILAFANLDI